MYVEAYWNLHDKCFSYRPPGGRVCHAKALVLLNPKFAVQPAGRNKVRVEKKKNVHAFVRGELVTAFHIGHTTDAVLANWKPLDEARRVRYNPYTDDQWHIDGKPIYAAKGRAYLIDRKVYLG